MKIAATILLFTTITQSVWACPKLSGTSPQDLQVIEEYTHRLSKVGNESVYNKTIYSCFKENLKDISWDQTLVIMEKLERATYTRANKSKITEKMAKGYLKKNFDVTFADVAVEVAGKMSEASDTNKMIKKYFKKALKRKMVGFEQLIILLNGLRKDYYNSNSSDKAADSMVEIFVKAKIKEITIPQIIELAIKGRSSDTKTNKTIKKYFDSHISKLSWEETTILMGALKSNYYGRSSAANISQRMTLAWNKVHN